MMFTGFFFFYLYKYDKDTSGGKSTLKLQRNCDAIILNRKNSLYNVKSGTYIKALTPKNILKHMQGPVCSLKSIILQPHVLSVCQDIYTCHVCLVECCFQPSIRNNWVLINSHITEHLTL